MVFWYLGYGVKESAGCDNVGTHGIIKTNEY